MLLHEISNLGGVALGSSIGLRFFDGKEFEVGLVFEINDTIENTSGKVPAFADLETKLFLITLCFRQVSNCHTHVIDTIALSQKGMQNRSLT
jgi:hypothetical protein